MTGVENATLSAHKFVSFLSAENTTIRCMFNFSNMVSFCIQPRRISAMGVAQRVAAERCESCGDIVG